MKLWGRLVDCELRARHDPPGSETPPESSMGSHTVQCCRCDRWVWVHTRDDEPEPTDTRW